MLEECAFSKEKANGVNPTKEKATGVNPIPARD